jgi:hypothetical protein
VKDSDITANKHLSLKGRPRGRPWPKGTLGNPAGRPRGSLHKTTLAVLAGNRPLTLDKSRHFAVWSDVFIQSGMKFRRDTLERVNPEGPVPVRPKRLNIPEGRQEVKWKGRRCWSQFGWLFDRATHLPLKP